MPTRQSLSDLIAGRPASPDGRAVLVYRPATRPIVEEALEAERRHALGRAIKVAGLDRRRMVAVRRELDHEYEAGNGLGQRPAAVDGRANFFSTSRT